MFSLGIALELDAQATPLNQDVYLRLCHTTFSHPMKSAGLARLLWLRFLQYVVKHAGAVVES